uniref:Transposase, MuDR, MULE transposase domain protein n=1 Tax=Tanacetum cinerariifolium TaxID=118510 RepID=A0A699I968_TANCI|nr:transposase, MuDR, MULE transposase domain protein [Tanacetum cinerariifolium]
MSAFINNKDLPEYRFPWGKRDIVIGRSFLLRLSCLKIGKSGWLTNQVYFPFNELKQHWCLAQLEIRTGVVTFYDSLDWASRSRRHWWRRMKKVLPEKLTLYLLMHGFGVRPDTLDPTIIKVSYPRGGHGSWYVYVFTLSSMGWKKLDNDSLPRESIRFKCSSQVVVGRLIIWAGHERLRLLELWDVTRVYRPNDIINDLNIEFNIDVSYKRAWKGKQLALKSNQGDPISSFAQLPYYRYNLKLANENTVTHIDIDHEGRFKMLFIAFGVAVRI